MRRPRIDLNYTIDVWDLAGDRHIETVATATNLAIARAAFEAAVVERQGRHITLRHGARLIHASPGIRQPWDPP